MRHGRKCVPVPNDFCADDADVLWGDWRLNDDPDTMEECQETLHHIGRSPVGPNDDYMLGTYSRVGRYRFLGT